jgi:hypothetical protein
MPDKILKERTAGARHTALKKDFLHYLLLFD